MKQPDLQGTCDAPIPVCGCGFTLDDLCMGRIAPYSFTDGRLFRCSRCGKTWVLAERDPLEHESYIY